MPGERTSQNKDRSAGLRRGQDYPSTTGGIAQSPAPRTFARVIQRPASFHAAVRSASQFWPRWELLLAGRWRTWTCSTARHSTARGVHAYKPQHSYRPDQPIL
jgi:hypothetical protein